MSTTLVGRLSGQLVMLVSKRRNATPPVSPRLGALAGVASVRPRRRISDELHDLCRLAPMSDIVRFVAGYPSLYEWAGGREAFDRMINAFYDRVEADQLLSGFFPGGVHEEHRRNVASWWSEVFEDPPRTPSNSEAMSGC